MLNATTRRALRARAHRLKPIVLIGQHGMSDAVQAEVDRALSDHELIKIRFRGVARDARSNDVERICTALAAERVQLVGGTAVLYRARPEAAPRARRAS